MITYGSWSGVIRLTKTQILHCYPLLSSFLLFLDPRLLPLSSFFLPRYFYHVYRRLCQRFMVVLFNSVVPEVPVTDRDLLIRICLKGRHFSYRWLQGVLVLKSDSKVGCKSSINGRPSPLCSFFSFSPVILHTITNQW